MIYRIPFLCYTFPERTRQMYLFDLTLRACFALVEWIKAGWTFVGFTRPPLVPCSGLSIDLSY